jgi:hypothetical protein
LPKQSVKRRLIQSPKTSRCSTFRWLEQGVRSGEPVTVDDRFEHDGVVFSKEQAANSRGLILGTQIRATRHPQLRATRQSYLGAARVVNRLDQGFATIRNGILIMPSASLNFLTFSVIHIITIQVAAMKRAKIYRLAGVLFCALAHGVFIGASWHAIVHSHTDECDHCDHAQHESAHSEGGAELLSSSADEDDCATCHLAAAAPDVPIHAVVVTNFTAPVFETIHIPLHFISSTDWSLPFGQGPPLA